MSSTLVAVTVLVTRSTTAANLPTGLTFKGTSVVVTDSSGTPQPAVLLTGSETPTPWQFSTSVAPGVGTVVATDLASDGSTLGTPITQSFTEAGTPATFLPASGITVTPA